MKRIVHFGMFTALALIFSYVESLIPISLGIPGVKLGLANLVIVLALDRMEVGQVYLLAVTRILLAGFLFSNLSSILYSLAGSLLSVTVMYFLNRTEKFSIVGVSVAGGVAHNVGQLVVAMTVLETLQLRYYLPVLIVAGIVTGLLIGVIASEMLVRIRRGNER